MNRGRYESFTRFLMLFAIGLAGLVPMGCDKENPVDEDDDLLTADLFPLAVGRMLVYTTYELDASTGQKVGSTVHRDVTYIQATVNVGGRNAYRLLDSIYTTHGTIERIDTTYVSLDKGDLYMWEGGGADGWYPFFKRSAGLNNEYIIYQYQETQDGTTFSVTLKGKFLPKESVTVPIGTLDAYKVELKVTVQVGSFTSEWVDQYIYLAEGYAVVRSTFPNRIDQGSNAKIQGEESLLVSKNF